MRAPSAVLASLLAAGCTPEPPPSAALFPLEPGHRWTYHQQTETAAGKSDSAWVVLRTLPDEDYAGVLTHRRRSDDGVDYWLRRDATGIYRVAAKHELQEEPEKDPAPRYVLKEPLAVGTEWQATTVPYLLERRQGFPLEVRHEGKAVPMRYAIEATDEAVSVPAGRFERCLRVRGQAVVRLYADGVAGWKDMPLTTTEWYCPGPGLVKLERDEPANSVFLTGGRLALELHEWERP
ncbi:MAG TPA: hypothetical protein VLI72_15020 [Methylibium sp.]|nr:hypothetical protein [Methylibium sp.]